MTLISHKEDLIPLAVILMSILLVIGCIQDSDNETMTSTTLVIATSSTATPSTSTSTTSIPVDELISECVKIKDQFLRDNCLMDKGKEYNNSGICGMIESEHFRDECYWAVAVNTKDPDICDLVVSDDDRDYCYRNVAVSIRNLTLCEKIVEREIFYICQKGIAIVEGDPDLCDIIQERRIRDDCYKAIAVDTDEPEICQGIFDIQKTESCYYDLALKLNRSDICEPLERIQRDICLKSTALAILDVALCEDISSTEWKNNCYDSISDLGYPFLCRYMEDVYWMDECYLRSAIGRQNSTLCENITDPGIRDTCIKQLTTTSTTSSTTIIRIEPCSLPATALDTEAECKAAGCDWFNATKGCCNSGLLSCGYSPGDHTCSIKASWSRKWDGEICECSRCDCSWCCCP